MLHQKPEILGYKRHFIGVNTVLGEGDNGPGILHHQGAIPHHIWDF
jgi:hypothetical protein